ncbi:hypothetical protein DPSP01_014492 [Paraphaeosphaeria sporulosa]
MKLLHTFIATAFLATVSCLEMGDLVSGQVYNASDVAELLKENPLDPGNGEGYEFPEGEGPTLPEDAEILENKYCYVQAFSGNHCDGKAGSKVRMERTNGIYGYIRIWHIPENNKAACQNVDLEGNNWQRMRWQKF